MLQYARAVDFVLAHEPMNASAGVVVQPIGMVAVEHATVVVIGCVRFRWLLRKGEDYVWRCGAWSAHIPGSLPVIY